MPEKQRLARGTQNRRLNATYRLRFAAQRDRLRLWRTFQPTRQEGRSIPIGVGQAATSVEITWEREPDCTSGSTCGTSQCYGLSSGTWHRYYTVVGLEHFGFFGEGMPRAAG